jgi:hypothetical protein
MGNVDTIRRIVREAMAKREQDSGPGSLLWFDLMDHLLVQYFLRFQHAQLEHSVGDFESFKQFQNKRKRKSLHRVYLMKLQRQIVPRPPTSIFRDCRGKSMAFSMYSPVLLLLLQGKWRDGGSITTRWTDHETISTEESHPAIC